MGAIAVRLSPRARLTRPLFATAPQYSDRLLGRSDHKSEKTLNLESMGGASGSNRGPAVSSG